MAQMESNEENTKRITVRVPKRLVEEYDEALGNRDTNRSEDLREYMRRVASTEHATDGRQPPTDDDFLARGYEALLEATGGSGRSIPLKQAKSAVAQQTSLNAEFVGRRVIGPLCERGYLQVWNSFTGHQSVVVR